MEIGKAIVEDSKLHIDDSNYETKSLRYLSRKLTNKFGKGFSFANLHFMIAFYNNYGNVQTLSKHLGWSHYCELLSISDKGNVNLEYALVGLNNKIFASKYVTYLPKKEELIRQVELIINKEK
jgi:hypothetical protein